MCLASWHTQPTIRNQPFWKSGAALRRVLGVGHAVSGSQGKGGPWGGVGTGNQREKTEGKAPNQVGVGAEVQKEGGEGQ